MTTYYRWNEQGLFAGTIEVDESGDLPLRSTPTAPPEIEGGQYVVWAGSAWIVTDEAPADTRDWAALIAAKRYEREMAGVEVGGMHVATDDRSKLLINGAVVEAMIDPDYVLRWKTGGAFIDLAAPEVIAVARAVRAYVQSCFDREDQLLAAVADGSITAELLEQGWPA